MRASDAFDSPNPHACSNERCGGVVSSGCQLAYGTEGWNDSAVTESQ